MPPTKPTDELLHLSTVLEEEYVKLHGAYKFNPPEGTTETTDGISKEEQAKKLKEQRLEAIIKAIHALPSKRSALCLSGGGIRSATFCFGVLQGLAKYRLLEKFDYLSTVSGGGYIGSWLTAWIHRAGVKHVSEELQSPPKSKTKPEPEEISHLRSFSNYLSPKLGLLSADTWTLAAIYLRNLFLNWLVLLPLLLAVLLIPRIYVSLISRKFGFDVSPIHTYITPKWLIYIVFGLGVVFGAIALAYIGSHRPSLRKHRKINGEKKDETDDKTTDDLPHFLYWCMIPLILSVILLTVGRAWYLSSGESLLLWQFAVGGAILHFLGWLFTFVAVAFFFGSTIFKGFVSNLKLRFFEGIVVLLTGALGGGLLWLLSIPEKIKGFSPIHYPEMYACLDGPQLMLVVLFMIILSVGIGSRFIDDEDKEWWARAAAWVLITIVVWAVLNSLVLYGPRLLPHLSPTEANMGTPITYFGIISGFVSILFAISSKTPANDRQAEKAGRLTIIMDYAVKMAAPAFALFLVVVLSFFTDQLINLIKFLPKIYNLLPRQWPAFPPLNHHDIVINSPFLFLLCLCGALLLISILMALCINVNQFSLHSMYRNRLVRAYLGASNKKYLHGRNQERKPNLFTGFDPNDDIKMSDLWPNEGKASQDAGKPLHIVNMTWNLVQGKNLAWQNRKATTFTVSPLHCGNHHYGYRRSKYYGGQPEDSISLGTALAISGAAASPNMGYYSSSAVTFLMTLFNVRLGWWLGNPTKQDYQTPGPRVALAPMINEAFGRTDKDKRYIYLSDGGHSENLGLYEMVLRRCHYIFVIDATSDPKYKFENLGNAIRRIRVDLGVTIEISDIVNYPRKQDNAGAYCAIGDILYTKVNEATDGVLIYIKPALRGGEPTDIFNYAQANLEFPHESTGDQFFSEQQFESYRVLGLHAIEQIFKKDWSVNNDFSKLKSHVEDYINGSKNTK